MRLSQGRVHEHGAALTPVRTGRMRSLLREQPTDGGLGFIVFWTADDFRAEAQEFYVPPVVFGHMVRLKGGGVKHVPANDPLTPALEAERPQLTRGLQAAAFRAARG
jgi:hypothetical protein